MSSLPHKLKVNNSYESEPSSGSGSSLSEHHDYNVSDDENMLLPYLLRAPSYETETTTSTMHLSNYTSTTQKVISQQILEQSERKLRYGIVLHSSQESTFEGFNESPCDKLQQQINTNPTQMATKVLKAEMSTSPAKIVFNKFYETILEENSCNAVDVQLSEELIQEHSSRNSESGTCDIIPCKDLSFNGRIKCLTEELTISAADVDTANANAIPNRLPTLLETSLNSSQFASTFILKKYSNEKSPDIFGDDDNDEDDNYCAEVIEKTTFDCSTEQRLQTESCIADAEPITEALDTSANRSHKSCTTENSFADEQTLDSVDDTQNFFRANCRRDKEMLCRIRKCLAGVPPPPSFTIPQLDLINAVISRKSEILNFLNEPIKTEQSECSSSSLVFSSLFKPTHTLIEAQTKGWRDVLGVRQHGLSFNLNKASESNEYLSLSVIDRFIGAETASSYRNSPTSTKKRSTRLKLLMQSPGNRLSHLARRRAMFSSANLATTSQKTNNSIGPQILLDKKKTKHRRKATPKRKTPGSKRKVRKTPSSSARKRLVRSELTKPGPSRETSKRALFQSPAKQSQQAKPLVAKPSIKPEIANRVEKSKRALFSPENRSAYPLQTSQLDMLLKRKRNTADDDDVELTPHCSKLFRGSTENLTPRALKIKSQSFCIGAGSSFSTATNTATSTAANAMSLLHNAKTEGDGCSSSGALFSHKLQRAYSDMLAPTNNLTENQRKKLLWAVSQALQERKITAKHESFKQYAAVLARVVRRIFQEYYQKSSTSNSETMLRLAKKYVFNVISGKNADDIYFQAKAKIDESKRLSCTRLSGYIGHEEYEQRKQLQQQQQLSQLQHSQALSGSIQTLSTLNESSLDTFSMFTASQSSCGLYGMSTTQTSFLANTVSCSQLSSSMAKSASKQQAIKPNATLQNSSSKNNLGGLALRENVDSEQRRSAQKNFTGKDQRNVSPYVSMSTSSSGAKRLGSGFKTQTHTVTDLNANAAKAKRQISFDS